MSSIRNTLEHVTENLEESMGVRVHDLRPRLSPVPSGRDTGRRPIRNVGRVEVNKVIPDPAQPRTEFSQDALDRLAGSIGEKGQLSPIRVRWSNEYGKWIIVTGERRWRAAKQAGLANIDCYFHEGDELTRSEVLEEQLVENLLREDLQPVEEAKAFSTLMELNGWTGKELASRLHIPQSKVTRALSLLKLPDDIQERVELGHISPRAAYQISRVNDDEKRRELADQAAQGKLSHEDAAKVVRQRKGKPKPKPRAVRQTFVSENGWKVVVSRNRLGTYFEIEEALQQVLDEVRHRIDNNVQLY